MKLQFKKFAGHVWVSLSMGALMTLGALVSSSVSFAAVDPHSNSSFIAPSIAKKGSDQTYRNCSAATFKTPRIVGDGKKTAGACYFTFGSASVGSYLALQSDDGNAQSTAACVGPSTAEHGGWRMQHAWCYATDRDLIGTRKSADIKLDSRSFKKDLKSN